MERPRRRSILLPFIAFLACVAVLSLLSMKLWGERPEKKSGPKTPTYQAEMTVAEFGSVNQIPNIVLKKVFGLSSKEDLQKKLKDFPLSQAQVTSSVIRANALEAEHESKNWVKIPVKFALWFFFLGFLFFRLRRGKVSAGNRRWFLLAAVILFGIILGSDPSPMGTVKDAIGLLGKTGAVFPPRMIALTLFLLLAFVANKLICSWGCQFGTFQDFIFRLNRDGKDRKGILRQFKPPFALTQTIRVSVLILFTAAAFSGRRT